MAGEHIFAHEIAGGIATYARLLRRLARQPDADRTKPAP